jgi:hypothetical protein
MAGNRAEQIHGVGNYDRVLLASITAVDPDAGEVSIAFLDQVGLRDHVPIPVIAMSNNAWGRFIPQVNDVVVVGIRGDDSAEIIGWHPWAYRARVRAFTADDINAAGGTGPEMLQKLKPGEWDFRSVGGGYLRLNDVGDVMLMGVSGRLQIWGLESLVEWAQNAFKVTDGQSWWRFGIPFRFYPGVNERELPASGGGQPGPALTTREADLKMVGPDGAILVHEGAGVVIDDGGTFELSGATGSGEFNRQSFSGAGKATTSFLPSGVTTDDIKARIAGALSALTDPMRDKANQVTTSVVKAIQSIVNGLGAADGLSTFTTILKGILNGDGGTSVVNGLGNSGKELRRRIHVFKAGSQVFALDVDENGGLVITSSDEDGIHLNAPFGGLQLFARRGLNLIARGIALLADTITEEADNEIHHVAGSTARRVAPNIKDNGSTLTRRAETSISDQSSGTISQQAGTSHSISATTITISATGAITISAGGIITVTATQVLIN